MGNIERTLMKPVIDAHFDLLMDVVIRRARGERRVIETSYLPDFLSGGINTVVAAVFVDSAFVPEMALRKALQQISSLHDEVRESSQIALCRTTEELEQARSQGKISFILSLEGADPLYNDLSMLRIFYELGVRILGLTWSRRNSAGEGSDFTPYPRRKSSGLSDFGLQLVEAAEAIGMLIDVSHLNDEGFRDVMEVANRPVIASHSNCRSLTQTMRNLSDVQIAAIARHNGVIGINSISMFVADRDEDANVDHMVRHIDHIVNLAGIEHVGIGLDLTDAFLKYVAAEDLAQMSRKPFDIFKGHAELPKLQETLSKRGYSAEHIDLILGGNFERAFKRVWK
ncbi:dipeptidase [Paenibacillus aestuarii]|uniref:Dipeptidase n=1 Tax=Paenibacillus aestuarii TaxID=516965 RepID=A0ABW0K976_9BACL|nr:dipeptidase [Paenibacillus aestuarii]